MNETPSVKPMETVGSLTPNLEGAPRSASHPRRSPPKPAPTQQESQP